MCMGIRIGCIQGVRLERVFVMDDVSNRVYSGSLYILNPIDPFLFALPTRRLVALFKAALLYLQMFIGNNIQYK